MKVLIIGDIVGRLGRQTVARFLPEYKQKNQIDWVIANGENLAGGIGLDEKTVKEVIKSGVDIITSGNHAFRRDGSMELFSNTKLPILRPANYPPETPGVGWRLFTNAIGQKIVVINLIGRIFFRENFDCPFRQADEILNQINNDPILKTENIDGIFIDFHAEATSEKTALANYLAGRITALVGTHTHVATNDARIIEDNTAYITDLGMTGSADSVLGVEKKVVIKQFLTQLPQKFMWKTSGPAIFCGAIIKTKKGSTKALSITKIYKNFD